MADQPSGAQANAPVTDEGIKLAQEYDKERDARVAAQNESKELGEGRKAQTGAVITGTGTLGQESQFVGKGDLAEAEYVLKSKGLEQPDTDGFDSSASWTAQSARTFQEVNPLDAPGQTFTVDELPDPTVVSASNLPAHAIPEALVVDARGVTDSLNTSQDRGGDLGTSPKADKTERVVARPNRDETPERPAGDKLVGAKRP